MFARLAERIVDHPWIVLGLVALVTAGGFVLWPHLGFDFTVEALFAGAQEERVFSDEFNGRFAHEDNLVVVILEALGDDDVLTPEAIRWQVDLAERLAEVEDVDRVVSLSSIRMPRPRFALGRSDLMMVPTIREDVEIDQEEAQRIRERVAATPLLDGMLISSDRVCASVVAYINHEVDHVAEVEVVVDGITDVLEASPPPVGYRWHVTGLPAIRLDITERLRDDQTRIVPLCSALFIAMLLLMYRSLSGLIIPWLSILVGLCWTMAMLVILDQPLNIVTNVLPVMIMVIGVSNCVHVVSYFSEQAIEQPSDKRSVALRTLRHMGLACLLTCLTTAIGFLSLLVADTQVLFDFGWQASMGMAFLYVSTMLVSGGLMPLLKAPNFGFQSQGNGSLHTGYRDSPLSQLAASIGAWSASRAWLTLAAAGGVVAIAALAGSTVPIDSKLIETYDETNQVVQTMELAEEELGGFMPLEVSLQADNDSRFQQPEVFFRVAQAAKYLRSLPETTLVRSYVDLYRQFDRAISDRELLEQDRPGDEVLNDPETTIALRDAHRRLSEPAFAAESRFFEYLTPDGTEGRISVHVRDMGINRARQVYADIEERLAEIFPESTGIQVRLTGDSYYSSKALYRLIGDLFRSLIGAAIVIFLVIAVLFRSARVGLVSVLPNLTPLVLTVGYMAFRGYELSTGNVIVFAISLGIAVDDTIHFLARFRDEAGQGDAFDDILRRTCLGTGRAIIMTSILIVAGLSVVHVSEFVPTRRFAELTSVTMCAALIGDLVLLPACLKLLWRQKPVLKAFVGEDAPELQRAAM